MRKINKQDKIFLKELGKRITQIRKKKGLTQVELGYELDMEKPNMNRIEKGGTNTTILTLKEICNELGISLSELFDGL